MRIVYWQESACCLYACEGGNRGFEAAGIQKGISLKEWSSRYGYKHLASTVSILTFFLIFFPKALSAGYQAISWIDYKDSMYSMFQRYLLKHLWSAFASSSADLQNAVQSENYDLAAKLRDEISELEAESLTTSIRAQAYENAQYAFRLGQKVKHKNFGMESLTFGVEGTAFV